MVIVSYWNCASGLLKKLDVIKNQIKSKKIDLFFVAESEISVDYDCNFLNIQGYETLFSETRTTRGRARLLCYAKINQFKRLPVNNHYNDVVVLQHGKKIFAGVYRGFKLFEAETERSNWARLFDELARIDYKNEVYIIGDLNVDIGRHDSRFHSELRDWTDTRGLNIINLGVTRRRKVLNRIQESNLDVILTNSDRFHHCVNFNDLSDHAIITANVMSHTFCEKEASSFTIFDWKFDVDAANKFLLEYFNSSPDLSSDRVSDIDYGIRAGLSITMSRFVRSTEIKIRSPTEVVSIKIKKLKNRKNYLRKKWLRTKNPGDWTLFLMASKSLRAEVRKTRAKILKSKLVLSPKVFWAEVNKLMGKQSSTIGRIIHNDKEIVEDQEVSNLFIDFFTNKVDKILGGYSPYIPNVLNMPVGAFPEFTIEEIDSAFDRLTSKKASGMDGLTCHFIKTFKTTLGPVVRELFNNIVLSNVIPETWKVAKIIPVFKKGSSVLVENYRPVSNLNAIPKVFEICLLQRLEMIDIDKLVSTSQHGFRKKHGTETAAASIVGKISDLLEQKRFVAIYSADLTAAFDVLRKEVLVDILIEKGVPMYLIRIIHEYLSDRLGYVQVGNSVSMVKDIKAGCIQGSIVGPFLFSIYMSHLQQVVSPWDSVVYADDSYVIIHGDNIDDLVGSTKTVMSKHFEWLSSIGMVCNQSKTELMIYGQYSVKIKVNNQEITSKSTIKVLGLLFDNNLRWQSQVKKILSRTRSVTFALRYLRRHLSLSEIKPVIYAQVVSRMAYGAPVWYHYLNFRQKAQLRSAFFRILRVLSRDFNLKLNRNGLLQVCDMDHIDNILFKRSSNFLFNLIFNLVPNDLAVKLLQRGYFNDRNVGKLHFFDCSSSKIGKACITNMASEIVSRWDFDWFFLTPDVFKLKLNEQLSRRN